jgi:imidazolonepropionase-like amidohydrolase
MKLIRLLLMAVLFCCVCISASAAEGRKALVGGTLIDGLGSTPLQDSVILVNGDKIERIGTVETLAVPEGYEVISTEGMSVLPGLWDMHVHLDINGHANYGHWHPAYADRMVDEIMPASAVQLLLAGVTTARDLGGPLEDSIIVRDRVNSGELPGPRLFVSGPFLQHKPYPGTESYRWGIDSPADARKKVDRLADAGVDIIKMVDQDLMTFEESQALVDQAHKRGLKVVGHSHTAPEIRRGLEIGVDNFEHTGLATAPEYPPDVVLALQERVGSAVVRGGPLYWTPTVEGLWNFVELRDNPESLDNSCWQRGLQPDTIADIKASIARPDQLLYFQLTPKRKPTLKRKFQQLRDSGVVLMVGTDSGIPLKFHCQSTWHELEVWVNVMGVPAMDTIQAATYWPSKFMGVEEQWGTVVPGRFADIIAVKGDVLKYINLLQDVDMVMKGGTIFKLDGRVVEENL